MNLVPLLEKINVPIFVRNESKVYLYYNRALLNFLEIADNNTLTRNLFIQPHIEDMQFHIFEYAHFDDPNLNKGHIGIAKSNCIESSKNSPKKLQQDSDQQSQFNFFDNANLIPRIRITFLTPREELILNLLAQGLTIKSIANHLLLSRHTIADYTKSIYLKLDAHSKTEAIYKAIALMKGAQN